MIELTVKTLDSQNHQFTVEDDITVQQFKVKIAETVNISAETQRIIYCGRVLQDNSKLADYDVNGKVVHLVQRPPPGTTPRSNSRSTSPQPQRRGFRGFRNLEQGNAMYLGSVAFPGSFMESQGIEPPPPTSSLSRSRLNVARRMLRRAENLIRVLEQNPSGRSQEQAAEENPEEEEEVTPVIEARVIVPNPNSGVEPIEDVLSAVQDTLLNAANNGGNTAPFEQIADDAAATPSTSEASATGTSPRSSTENLASDSRPAPSSRLPENASRIGDLSELLTMLTQIQIRFAPFLERYQQFTRDDPDVTGDDVRTTQNMLNRVSEVMHLLGHAYHSLSDLIIRVRTPPGLPSRPRPLLCRPILIQHSAVLQTGIPIQVEAQINLTAERNSSSNADPSAPPEPPTYTLHATPVSVPNARPIQVPPVGMVGMPFMANAGTRVQSIPVEVRASRAQPRSQNGTPDSTAAAPTFELTYLRASTGNETPTTTASDAGTGSDTGGTGADTTPNNQEGQQQGAGHNFNNPNVEFFMEVTPEGITIDSLETALVGSNQANDLLRGALNGPPPELLNSLMQMAGQIMNRNIATTTTTASPTPATTSSESSQAQSGAAQGATPNRGQNSQPRGGAQTNPTTSTHTRPTSRSNVHLAQRAMQGIRSGRHFRSRSHRCGFDPFLPCSSHHITRRRVNIDHLPPPPNWQPTAATNEPNTANNDDDGGPPDFQSLVNAFLSVRNSGSRRIGPLQANNEAGTSTSTTSINMPNSIDSIGAFNLPQISSIFSLTDMNGESTNPLRPDSTLEELVNQFQDEQYIPGENLLVDLIMLFVRNFSIVDILSLYGGSVEPINRHVRVLKAFFRTRICESDTTPSGIDRGIDRIIRELQPFLENFRSLPVQNNIDMVRSAEQLFRQRLPNIIYIGINLNGGATRLLVEQCITTAKQLLALTLLASSTGRNGVEQVYEQVMSYFMRDVPQYVQNWTLMTSRVRLRQILSNLNIPESLLQPYIVHRPMTPILEPMVENETEVESMEVDAQETRTENNPSAIIPDPEPLPNVVIGSEPWHNQVPEDWVPIITRDAQKQRRQNPQGPFSDAYLSGMPSKRRKIVNGSKPHGNLPHVITESVRQAVSSSGLSSAAPLDVVVQAAGASTELQNAYRNLLRSTVQSNLKDNEDFLPDKYPNVSNYFNNSGSQ
ncbi:large proline-rich protein bag6-A isoform X4 [Diabrotica virgifera virgifera]|uniref:BCL2-associated athanogene 6 n=1 Tax=Diabrotica virgifera virgifera TaxID=50390 RepID=A0ABM5KM17_DIAVI|nr:large proline-rich protein bag6-A isoform X4 [Diabrotica virgifera virgifera]